MSETQSVTINSPPSGPVAPAAPLDPNRSFRPEKFSTDEAWAVAYKELEQKQSQAGAEKKPTEGEPEKTPAEDPKKPTEGEPDAEAEKQATEVLKVAGLDMSAFSTEFSTDGKLSDESYTKLEAAGFPRNVVDTYIAGQTAGAKEAAGLVESQIKTLKDSVGGEEKYLSLITWAGANLTADEQTAYNAMVSSTSTAKAGVEWLQSRFNSVEGVEPTLLAGGLTSVAPQDTFGSMHEVVEAMKDARYKKGDPAFHKAVQEKLGRSKNLR